MSAAEEVLTSLGVDYITATVRDKSASWRLASMGTAMFRTQADRGNVPRPFGMSGFKGWKCGSVECAMRNEEYMLRASGDAAAYAWKEIVPLADHISRLDLQATIKVGCGPTKQIERHRRAARAYSTKMHNKPIVRWTADHRGGYTLYLGARESICFGRIYDKFAQSGLDHYQSCVRYEVQYHNKLATNLAVQLAAQASSLPHTAAFVSQFFRGRGVSLEVPYDDKATYCCSRPRSDDDKCLKWLQTAVRPSVLRLINAGKGEEVMRALGLIADES